MGKDSTIRDEKMEKKSETLQMSLSVFVADFFLSRSTFPHRNK